jgi:hypothetical protein
MKKVMAISWANAEVLRLNPPSARHAQRNTGIVVFIANVLAIPQ